MRTEDLLGERSARARQPDDKHRLVGAYAESAATREKFRLVRRNYAVDARNQRRAIQRPGIPAARGIGLQASGRGFAVAAATVVIFGEAVTYHCPGLVFHHGMGQSGLRARQQDPGGALAHQAQVLGQERPHAQAGAAGH